MDASLGIAPLFEIVTMVLVFLFVLALVFMALVFRFLTGGKGRRNARNDVGRAEETQRMHADLMRMEKRIEALETLLIERSGGR